MPNPSQEKQHASEQTAEALQESVQGFRAVWENASDAMALSGPDGNVIAANPAYFHLYGYSPEEVIGNNYSIIFPEEQRKWAQELYSYIFQSPIISPAFEASTRRADGTERIVEASYSFLTSYGTRTAMLSIIRDITARKKAEEALRESELKLHLALELGRMGAWEWDILSNSVHWSANMEAAFGLPPGSFKGTYEDFLQLVHPQDRALVEQEIRRALEDGTDYQVEFHAVRPDGSILWTRNRGQVLHDESGKPIRMIGVSMDITEASAI